MVTISEKLPAAYSLAVLDDVCRLCKIADGFSRLALIARKIAADQELSDYAVSLYNEFSASANWCSPVWSIMAS